MISKTKVISVDLKKIASVGSTVPSLTKPQSSSIRSSIFSLGTDPRIGSLQLSTPDFYLIELLRDQLKQLYVRLNWKMPRFDIDSGKVIGFNVYRKKISTSSNRKLTRGQFEKLTINLRKNGDFSEDRKGIYNVGRGLIPGNVLNSNTKIESGQINAGFSRNTRGFQKIAFVDFSQFIAKEKQKTVFSVDAENISVFYDDETVGFGEIFEYFISAVSAHLEETFQSDLIRVLIKDNEQISPPDVAAKQIDENSTLLKILFRKEHQIDNVVIFRKEVDSDPFFIKIKELPNVGFSSAEFLDHHTAFGKEFIYRIFTRNIHGVLSPPAEFRFISSVNLEKSRTNNIRKPEFHAIQQKNVARLVVSPNDSRVLFYKVDRRDLSVHEKKFIVPSRNTNGFGGNGWSSNQIFYNRTNLTLVQFIDDTVDGGHVYQYRLIGEDRFGNKTSCSYQTIEIIDQELLHSLVNIKISLLRESPFRVKLSWDDTNQYEKGIVPLYEIQRRQGHNTFASFPLTENKFIIDEISSIDALPFLTSKVEDTFNKIQPNNITSAKDSLSQLSISVPTLTAPTSPPISTSVFRPPAVVPFLETQVRRSFGVLDFLKENLFYFYRVKVLTRDGSTSVFSDEVKLTTFRPLSRPVNFEASVESEKVKPVVVMLFWDVEEGKSVPDHFVIQRKIDHPNDSYIVVGKAYFEYEFFDRNVSIGKNYIYRIKSVNTIGEQTEFSEVRVST